MGTKESPSEAPSSGSDWENLDRRLKAELWGEDEDAPHGPVPRGTQPDLDDVIAGSARVFVPRGSSNENPVIQSRILRRALEELENGELSPVETYLEAFPDHHRLVRREHARLSKHRSTAPPDIGPYHLISLLGRGGQGTVHLAEDTRLGRQVALKILDPGSNPNPTHLARFLREAELTARLEDEGICPIYEVSVHDGHACIAMRYLQGQSLRSLVDEKKSPTREELAARLVLMEKVARSLHVAHEKGVAHRDVKPGNIILQGPDRPVLVDFGLARTPHEDTVSLTREGAPLGTPAYMAPELLSGQGDVLRAFDIPADIWSFGVTLFELTTSQRPFDGPTREALYRAILTEPAADPRSLNPKISRELLIVLETCLQKNPHHRYRSMAEVADELSRIRAGRPIHARRPNVLRRTRRWMERQPALAASLALSFLLLAIGLTVSGTLWKRERQERARAENALQAERLAHRHAEGLRLTAQARALEESRPGLALLLAIEGARLQESPHALETVSDLLTAQVEDQVLVGHEGPVLGASFASDGHRVVSISSDRSAKVWDPESGRCLGSFMGHQAPLTSLDTGAHGRVVTGDREGVVILWNAHTLEPCLRVEAHRAPVLSVQFDRTAERLVTTAEDGSAILWRWGDSSEIRRIDSSEASITAVAFEPQTGDVLLGDARGDVTRWNSHGRHRIDDRAPLRSRRCVAIHPDARMSVLIGNDAILETYSRTGAHSPRVLDGHDQSIVCASFDLKTRLLATGSRDRTAVLRDLASPSEAPYSILRGHRGPILDVRFAANGNRAVTASADGTARVWTLRRPPHSWRQTSSGALFDIVGDQVACLHPDGTISWRSLSSGELEVAQEAHVGEIFKTRLSADGSRWVTIGSDATVQLWRTSDFGRERRLDILSAYPGEALDAQLSDDGSKLITVTRAGYAPILDLDSGQVTVTVEGHPIEEVPGAVSALFGREGKKVVTVTRQGNKNSLTLWDAVTGRSLASLEAPGRKIQDLARSPRGDLIAWARDDGLLRLSSFTSPDQVRTLLGHEDEIVDITFDQVGERLLSASQDGTARLWSSTGEELVVLRGHEGPLTGAHFSPCGTRVLTTSFDQTVRLWDVMNGELLMVQRGHDRVVTMARFTNDGDSVLSLSVEGSMRLWPTDPLDHVESWFKRTFTKEERLEFSLVERTR